MEGGPFWNDALEVKALGIGGYGERQLGMLLTLRFMNLMMLPKDAERYTQYAST